MQALLVGLVAVALAYRVQVAVVPLDKVLLVPAVAGPTMAAEAAVEEAVLAVQGRQLRVAQEG
jgi:hypothetical protein